MHRMLMALAALGLLTGCEPGSSAAPAATAANTSRTPTDPASGAGLGAIASRFTEAGVVAAAAAPYVYARECGASDTQLAAYKRAARAQLQKLPTFSAADFEIDFEAGVRLMARQARLDHGPLDEARHAGTCQWAFDVVARE